MHDRQAKPAEHRGEQRARDAALGTRSSASGMASWPSVYAGPVMLHSNA